MASPKIIAFTVYNSSGVPLAGTAGSLTFTAYKDETGANLSQPSFVEIGGGEYYFTPTYTSGHGIAFVISTLNNPLYISGYTRPEDWNTDSIDAATSAVLSAITALQTDVTLIKKLDKNKWEIKTTGLDANNMLFYDDDGTTVILRVALKDAAGTPTTVAPYSRTPI